MDGWGIATLVTHGIEIWEKSDSRTAIHWEGHKWFDIQGGLHHERRRADKGRERSCVARAACREKNIYI